MVSRRLTASLTYPRRVGSTRAATRVDYHSLGLIIGLLALAASAGVLYLLQASMAAELRYRLADAEWERRILWEGNLALQQQLSAAECLATVEHRAADLGMVNAPAQGAYVACVVPGPRPPAMRRPAGLARAMAAEEQAPNPLESLLAGLRERAGQPDGQTAMEAERP